MASLAAPPGKAALLAHEAGRLAAGDLAVDRGEHRRRRVAENRTRGR
jgi:hypothetical protein